MSILIFGLRHKPDVILLRLKAPLKTRDFLNLDKGKQVAVNSALLGKRLYKRYLRY